MECKKVQEWLITDHLDGELTPAESSSVRQHVEGCAACREFWEAVRGTLEEPFKGISELQPDPIVWQKIRGMIATEGARSEGWIEKIGRALEPVLRPLPAFRFAFVAAMVLMVVVLVKWPLSRVDPAYTYVQEQMSFMGELQSGDPDLLNGDPDVYETAFEDIMK